VRARRPCGVRLCHGRRSAQPLSGESHDFFSFSSLSSSLLLSSFPFLFFSVKNRAPGAAGIAQTIRHQLFETCRRPGSPNTVTLPGKFGRPKVAMLSRTVRATHFRRAPPRLSSIGDIPGSRSANLAPRRGSTDRGRIQKRVRGVIDGLEPPPPQRRSVPLRASWSRPIRNANAAPGRADCVSAAVEPHPPRGRSHQRPPRGRVPHIEGVRGKKNKFLAPSHQLGVYSRDQIALFQASNKKQGM